MKKRFYLWTGIVVALVVAAALVLVAARRAGIVMPHQARTPPALAGKLHKPVSGAFMATLQKASRAGLNLTATKPVDVHLQPIAGPRLNTSSKVGLLYIGGDFCPYCAAQRWGLVLTLLRFGDINGLQYMLSSPADSHPNTATVTFQRVEYQSKYVSLQAVEGWDRHVHKLTPLDPLQTRIFATYDAPPYTPDPGGIPFVYLDGHYMLTDPMLKASEIAGMTWQQIADGFADPRSKLFVDIMPNVNLMTAAICQLDGGNPTDVCTSPGVIAANAALLQLRSTTH
jgi:hypothetical protein